MHEGVAVAVSALQVVVVQDEGTFEVGPAHLHSGRSSDA